MGGSAGLSGDPIAVSIMVNPLNTRKAMLMVRICIWIYVHTKIHIYTCIYKLQMFHVLISKYRYIDIMYTYI